MCCRNEKMAIYSTHTKIEYGSSFCNVWIYCVYQMQYLRRLKDYEKWFSSTLCNIFFFHNRMVLYNNKLYLFGGITVGTQKMNDILSYSFGTFFIHKDSYSTTKTTERKFCNRFFGIDRQKCVESCDSKINSSSRALGVQIVKYENFCFFFLSNKSNDIWILSSVY